MPSDSKLTSQRKKEHIEICLTNAPAFKEKKTGFDNYEFIHNAATEVDISKINFESLFFTKKISYPFLISCMTGGTSEAGNINSQLAESANNLNIPLGVGSQRQALENEEYHKTYKIIREKAPNIPILGNIGAAQIVKMKSFDQIQYLVDLVEADVMVIHLNPVQELLQKNGEPDFNGLLKSIGGLVKQIDVPVIAKEVGSGISKSTAEKLISAGVQGIDVAGAGGTSWAAVEILRNHNDNGESEIPGQDELWEWGLPTSYCIRSVAELKKIHHFMLIGSGGVNNGVDAAKVFALGADITASARIILQELNKTGVNGVNNLILSWFEIIKKIMFLTGSGTLNELKRNKLIRKEELY